MLRSDVFIDSNLWIYAFLDASNDHEKRETVLSFLKAVRSKSMIIVSVQVINEFHWILSRKYKVAESEIRIKVNDGILKIADVVPLQISTCQSANHLRDTYNFSYWDSMLVASAIENNCAALYSEDMQSGMVVDEI